MNKIFNFGAGPSMMPAEVKRRAREELFGDADGISLLEMSADSEPVRKVREDCESNLRKLLSIPSNYIVLFIDGAGINQFSAIPLNLLSDGKKADYIITGQYSSLAYQEAKKYGDVIIAASSAGSLPIFSSIPALKPSDFRPDTDYAHICFNNTIYGTKYDKIPDTGHIPLIADMTSSLLSEPVDVSKFAMIYADAGPNIAPAPFTVVIIREDIIADSRSDIPSSLNYRVLANGGHYASTSIYNMYMANLCFEWLLSIGGLEEIKRRNERKASKLYDFLDGNDYYTPPANGRFRSMTNVVFTTGVPKLDMKFIEDAAAEGLVGLEGHPSLGGLRASLYNAMPIEGVEKLVNFMKRFMGENSKFKDLF